VPLHHSTCHQRWHTVIFCTDDSGTDRPACVAAAAAVSAVIRLLPVTSHSRTASHPAPTTYLLPPAAAAAGPAAAAVLLAAVPFPLRCLDRPWLAAPPAPPKGLMVCSSSRHTTSPQHEGHLPAAGRPDRTWLLPMLGLAALLPDAAAAADAGILSGTPRPCCCCCCRSA
jgi:hypothetical protein